jgi:hypothetical protein
MRRRMERPRQATVSAMTWCVTAVDAAAGVDVAVVASAKGRSATESGTDKSGTDKSGTDKSGTIAVIGKHRLPVPQLMVSGKRRARNQ